MLIVGGGDSALEAATSISQVAGTRVALSYRSEAFNRVKAANRERLRAATEAGKVKFLMRSEVIAIEGDKVRLKLAEDELALDNDAVIISAGGVLPTEFLKSIGIKIETKYGTV